MFRVSNQKKKLASGIGFISLVTFETRTEEEVVSIFELGVVLLPPAAPHSRERRLREDARVVS
tara:strand:- start:189 stop:377 length:189 start_codon:yes stop_codon:yes gene_type:complete